MCLSSIVLVSDLGQLLPQLLRSLGCPARSFKTAGEDAAGDHQNEVNRVARGEIHELALCEVNLPRDDVAARQIILGLMLLTALFAFARGSVPSQLLLSNPARECGVPNT